MNEIANTKLWLSESAQPTDTLDRRVGAVLHDYNPIAHMPLRMIMRRAMTLVLRATSERSHATERPAHGPHVVAEDVLATHWAIITPRTLRAHANAENSRKP